MPKDKEQFWSEVWDILRNALKQISINTEDEEKLRKIWKFYQRKRNTAGGQSKTMAAGILYAYARINFLNFEQKPWRQQNIAGLCGINPTVAGSKAKQIMDGLKMEMMDQRFARDEIAKKNPWNKLMVNPQTGFLFMDDDNTDIPGIHVKRTKSDYYYDAMEALNVGDSDAALRLLKKAFAIDEHYLAGFVGMAAVYLEKGNLTKHAQYVNTGFAEVRKLYPEWPDRMEWGILENRPALRLICYKAILEHHAGNLQEAEKLYRLLLKLNRWDNQGVRYLLSGMFAGKTADDIDDLTDEGNEKQDWSKLDNLLDEQNSKHNFWQPPE